jgi:hypothetical protein
MYACLNADEGVKIDKFQKALRQYELLRNQGETFDNRNLFFKGFLSMINKHSNIRNYCCERRSIGRTEYRRRSGKKHKKNSNIFPNGIKN